MKRNNSNFPHLPEKEINKLVEELTDPDLLPLSQPTEEELLLLKVLARKLEKGLIKAEMTKDGKLWLKTQINLGKIQIKYQNKSNKYGK